MLEQLLTRQSEARSDYQVLLPNYQDNFQTVLFAFGLRAKGDELVELKAQQTKLRLTGWMYNSWVSSVMQNIRAKDLTTRVYEEITTRIANETTLMDRVTEMDDVLNNGISGNPPIDYPQIDWNRKCEINGISCDGYYDPRIDYIRLKEAEPEDEGVVIESLANTGRVPKGLSDLGHEVTHAGQFRLGGLENEASEAQAYRVETGSLLNFPGQSRASLIIGCDSYAHLDPAKVKFAFWAVDSLNALGLTQVQLTETLQRSTSWDERRGIWPYIYDAVQDHQQAAGFDDHDLERAKIAAELKDSITILQSRVIAQDVLKKHTRPIFKFLK